MAKFVPITFAFEAEDQDLGAKLKATKKGMLGVDDAMGNVNRSAKRMSGGFASIGSTARSLGKIATAPFKAMGSVISGIERRVAQFNLASIAQDIKGLTGQTGTLSDEMDSAFASNAKAVKPMLAALGKSGKELRALTGKAAGMAYGMNLSAEAVGKVMVELESAGGPAKKGLDALGMSTKEFVKFAEVSGMDIADLSANIGDLQTSWNMSAKQAAKTTEEMLAYGQAVGIGSQGLMQFKPLMDKMNAALADAPPNMRLTNEEMKTLAESSVKLAGAYREMGASQEQSMEFSQATAELFVKESTNYQKAITGQASDYGQMSKDMMSVMGGWGVSWEEFGQILKMGAVDSTKGMMGLQQIVQSASAKGFGPAEVLMGKLLGTISETSPAMAWLAQNTNKGQEALQKFNGITVKSEGSLKQFANEGYSAGFTLQETFDRARLAMQHTIRSISMGEARDYVQTQIKSYRRVGKEVQGLAKDPAWGGLVKKLSLLKSAGLQGVIMSMATDKKSKQAIGETFTKLELVGSAVEDISNAAAPLMTTLGKFGPLGTMAGGLVTWFMIPKDKRDQIFQDLQPLFDKIKETASNIWYGENGEAGLKAKLSGFFNETLVPLFKEYAPIIGSALWDGISMIGGKLVDSISELFSSSSGSTMAAAFGAALLGSSFFTGGLTTAIVGAASLALGLVMKEGKAVQKPTAGEQQAAKLAAEIRKNTYDVATSTTSGDEWWLDPALVEAGRSDLSTMGTSEDLVAQMQEDVSLRQAGIQQYGERTLGRGRYRAGPGIQRGSGVFKTAAVEGAQDIFQTALEREQGPNVKDIMSGKMLSPTHQLTKGLKGFQLWAMEKILGRKVTDPTGQILAGLQGAQGVPEIQQQLKTLSTASDKVGAAEGVAGLGQTFGGMTQDQMYANLEQRAQTSVKREQAAQQALANLPASLDAINNTVTLKAEEMASISREGAAQAVIGFATSFFNETPYLEKTVNDTLDVAASQMRFGSPPMTGPFSEAAGNPAYNGGMGMMQLLAEGITAGQIVVQTAMEEALKTSFEAAMGVYEDFAAVRISASDVMARVADQLVTQLGGVGNIQWTTQETQILKTVIDVPGMAGVSGAILADGNLTRKVLARIAEATEGMYEIVKKPVTAPQKSIVLAGR